MIYRGFERGEGWRGERKVGVVDVAVDVLLESRLLFFCVEDLQRESRESS